MVSVSFTYLNFILHAFGQRQLLCYGFKHLDNKQWKVVNLKKEATHIQTANER